MARLPPTPAVTPAPAVMPGETGISSEGESWITVGKVLKTIGLKGWVKIQSNSDYPDRFRKDSALYLEAQPGDFQEIRVLASRSRGSSEFLDLLLEGSTDPESARRFVGKTLSIPLSQRSDPPGGSFYPDELEGMAVLSPAGQQVGRVELLEAEVPCPFLVIRSETLGEVMVPFRKVFIASVDRSRRIVQLVVPIEEHIPVE